MSNRTAVLANYLVYQYFGSSRIQKNLFYTTHFLSQYGYLPGISSSNG